MRTATRSKAVAALLALLAVGLFGGWAVAQGDEGGEAPAAQSKSFFTIYIIEGGAVAFVIIALSIWVIALIIEFSISFQRDKLVPPDIIVELEQLLDEEQYEEALTLCESQRNYICNAVGAALTRMNDGYETMVTSLETALAEEDMKLAHKISLLNLLGNLGPLLGLFGTVTGMVTAFTVIATSSSQPTPAEMAGGIYTALVTTVWGLLVAMPALSALFVFKNKLQKLSFELASVAAEMVERFKPGAPAGGK